MKTRLGGERNAGSKPEEFTPASASGGSSASKVVLGVDPSLRGTGFGVIEWSRNTGAALVHGTIRCPSSWPRSRCLAEIVRTLREVVHRHQPMECVMEGLFYAQNLQTALLMGEARGAAISVVAEAGLTVYEIAPRKVKQAVVGYGAAGKSAVSKMMQRLLQLNETPLPDAADALALAWTHAQESVRHGLYPPKRI